MIRKSGGLWARTRVHGKVGGAGRVGAAEGLGKVVDLKVDATGRCYEAMSYFCVMKSLFLKFPSLLGGNGDATAYLVLAVIVLLVVAVFYVVYRLLQEDREA